MRHWPTHKDPNCHYAVSYNAFGEVLVQIQGQQLNGEYDQLRIQLTQTEARYMAQLLCASAERAYLAEKSSI